MHWSLRLLISFCVVLFVLAPICIISAWAIELELTGFLYYTVQTYAGIGILGSFVVAITLILFTLGMFEPL